MDIYYSTAHNHTTMSCVSVAHRSLVATAAAAASWRVSMNLKALSPPGDKTALFVCGALHPATKAFRMLRAPSFSLSSLAITSPPSSAFDVGLHKDDIEWVLHALSNMPVMVFLTYGFGLHGEVMCKGCGSDLRPTIKHVCSAQFLLFHPFLFQINYICPPCVFVFPLNLKFKAYLPFSIVLAIRCTKSNVMHASCL